MFNNIRAALAVFVLLALATGFGFTAPASAQSQLEIEAALLKGGKDSVFPYLAQEAMKHRFCREAGGSWISCEFSYERSLKAYAVQAWEEASFTVVFDAGDKPASISERSWKREAQLNGTWKCGFVRISRDNTVQKDKTPICQRGTIWWMAEYGRHQDTLWAAKIMAAATGTQQPVQVAVAPALKPAPRPAPVAEKLAADKPEVFDGQLYDHQDAISALVEGEPMVISDDQQFAFSMVSPVEIIEKRVVLMELGFAEIDQRIQVLEMRANPRGRREITLFRTTQGEWVMLAKAG